MKAVRALPPVWTISYLLIYLPWFTALEARDPLKCTIVQLEIDRMIPFCEYFIVPYLLWFFYIGAGVIYLMCALPRRDYYRFAVLFFGGLTVCLILNTVFYTGLHLRPWINPGKNVFTLLVAKLWASDTSTNVCPSIHVFATLVLSRALGRQPLVAERPPLRWCNQLLAVSIILSTMLLKQHSVIDVFCAFLLYGVLWTALYGPAPVTARQGQRVGA